MVISPEIYNNLRGIVFMKSEPPTTNVVWAKPIEPVGDVFDFFVYDRGMWISMSEYDNVVIPPISILLSDFTNDVGYLTENNFKTINNESIVGEGNIEIQGGGDIQVIKVNNTPLTPDENHAVNIDLTGYATTSDLSNKQDTLVSGTTIKTINNESILTEGNINTSYVTFRVWSTT